VSIRSGFTGVLTTGLLLAACSAHAADGDLDPTFGDGGVVRLGTTSPYGAPSIALQADGRIVVCDAIEEGGSGYDAWVARFNRDGTPDTGFGVKGAVALSFDTSGADDLCSAIAIDSNGRIVIAGVRSHPDFGTSYPHFLVARLDADGSLDPTFAAGAGFVEFVFGDSGLGAARAVALDADGRIVVAGGAQLVSLDEDFAVARLMPDGSFDTSFNATGELTFGYFPGSFSYDYATHVAVDSQGRIVLSGMASSSAALARLMSDGSFDDGFGADGSVLTDQFGGAGFLIDRVGRLVIAGSVGTPSGAGLNGDFGIARFLDDGSPDPTFGIGGISTIAFDETSDGSDVALCVVEQPDGKLAALGSAQYGDAGYITDAAATRVGEDGLLDASFGRTGKEVFTFGPSPPNWQWLSAAATDAAFGRVVAVGAVLDDETGAVEDVLVRLQNDDIFADGFD
jgi:uncharacterized delta-60 repeat protein